MDQRTKTKPFPSADEIANLAKMEEGIAELTGEFKPGGIEYVKQPMELIQPPDDPINPAHYRKHPSGIECIEVVRHMTFNLGQVFKYIWRADHKNATIEDLKKAQWYLDDEIRRLEGKR